jgi:hypothetical protein
MDLPKDFKLKVLNALQEKKTKPKCEICDQNTWSVVDQPASLLIPDQSAGGSRPPQNIPCAALICNNCGNVRLFMLGILGA